MFSSLDAGKVWLKIAFPPEPADEAAPSCSVQERPRLQKKISIEATRGHKCQLLSEVAGLGEQQQLRNSLVQEKLHALYTALHWR